MLPQVHKQVEEVVAMKTYAKSIKWKQPCIGGGAGDDSSPCKKCKEEPCQGKTCRTLQQWQDRVHEYAIEWEVCHEGLEIARIVSKAIIWLAMIGSMVFVVLKLCKQ